MYCCPSCTFTGKAHQGSCHGYSTTQMHTGRPYWVPHTEKGLSGSWHHSSHAVLSMVYCIMHGAWGAALGNDLGVVGAGVRRWVA